MENPGLMPIEAELERLEDAIRQQRAAIEAVKAALWRDRQDLWTMLQAYHAELEDLRRRVTARGA